MNKNPDNVVDFVLQYYPYIAKKLIALRLTESEAYQVISRLFGHEIEDFYVEKLIMTLNRKEFLLTIKNSRIPEVNDLSFTLSSGKRVYLAELGDYD